MEYLFSAFAIVHAFYHIRRILPQLPPLTPHYQQKNKVSLLIEQSIWIHHIVSCFARIIYYLKSQTNPLFLKTYRSTQGTTEDLKEVTEMKVFHQNKPPLSLLLFNNWFTITFTTYPHCFAITHN